MCVLKGSPCIQEKLEAEGKAKGPCSCILKQAEEKKKAFDSNIKLSQQYETDHPEDLEFNELKAKTLKRKEEELK